MGCSMLIPRAVIEVGGVLCKSFVCGHGFKFLLIRAQAGGLPLRRAVQIVKKVPGGSGVDAPGSFQPPPATCAVAAESLAGKAFFSESAVRAKRTGDFCKPQKSGVRHFFDSKGHRHCAGGL